MTLELDTNNWFFVVVPTSLPVPDLYVGNMTAEIQDNLRKLSGEDYGGTNGTAKNRYNMFYNIILYGANASGDWSYMQEADLSGFTNVDTLLAKVRGTGNEGITARLNWMRAGWNQAKEYAEFLGLL